MVESAIGDMDTAEALVSWFITGVAAVIKILVIVYRFAVFVVLHVDKGRGETGVGMKVVVRRFGRFSSNPSTA